MYTYECGFTEYELSYVGLGEIAARAGGYVKRRRGEQLEQWRQTRYLAFVQISSNPYIKAQDKPRRPEDLFLLESDTFQEMNEQKLMERYEKSKVLWRYLTN